MKLRLWLTLLLASIFVLNCGEKEIKSIDLKDAIFRAEGNHPSWKLELDSNDGIHFYSNSEFGKITTSNSKKNILLDIDATSYHAKTELAEIKVVIFRKQCLDSKEHKEFKFEVKVATKNKGDENFSNFTGCGEYL